MLNTNANRYWIHELICCGIDVELLRVKEPQLASQLSKEHKITVKRAQRSDARHSAKKPRILSDATCDVITISSDDDVFEK